MSKKVFKWMIADIIFIGVMTLLFLWIKRSIMFAISNEKIKEYINVALWILYAIADFFVLIWFLYYWWCDRKLTQLKSCINRKLKRR